MYLSIKNKRETRFTIERDKYQVEKGGVFCKLVKSASNAFAIPEEDDVIKIGPRAFADSSRSRLNILTSVTISRQVKDVHDESFNDCSHLAEIKTKGGNTVFCGHSDGILFNRLDTEVVRCPEGSSVESYSIPKGVTQISPYAFFQCQHLKSISLPETVKTICDYAFSGCPNLQVVKLPNKLETISNYAFSDCASLQSVNRPTQLQGGIGSEVFSGCVNLSNKAMSDWKDVLLQSPSMKSIVIPKGTTSILDRFYKGWTSLNSVYIPKTVTSIGRGAFHGCSKLKTIRTSYTCCCCSFWESVIFPLVLHGCSFLKVAVIPDSVTSIGEGAFRFCSSLESIVIPKGVTKIEDYTFSDCSGLVEVSFRGDIESIGNCSFAHCRDLKLIELPTSVTSIGDGAFSGCASLESIKIPADVTSIGDWTFSGCSSLSSIEIPSDMTSIGDRAFVGCSSLTEIEVDSNNPKYCSRIRRLFLLDGN